MILGRTKGRKTEYETLSIENSDEESNSNHESDGENGEQDEENNSNDDSEGEDGEQEAGQGNELDQGHVEEGAELTSEERATEDENPEHEEIEREPEEIEEDKQEERRGQRRGRIDETIKQDDENVDEGKNEPARKGLHEIPKLRKGDNIRVTCNETGEEKCFEILGPAGKRTGSKQTVKKWSDSYNVKEYESGRECWVNLRNFDNVRRIIQEEEVLLGCEAGDIMEAKEKEFESWKNNNVYEEVMNTGQKTMSVRWVITNKLKEGKMTCKARLVARGFEESDQGMEKEAPTCAAEAFRLGLAIILMKGWQVQTLDVKTAYLQGEEIQRDVFVKPPVEAKTRGIWKLKKTIYGLKDAVRAWYDSVTTIILELGGKRSRFEPTLFTWRNENLELIGLMCIHVDDFCYGGNREFNDEVISKMSQRLRVGETQKGKFCYLGVEVEQSNNMIHLNQFNYIRRMCLPRMREFERKDSLNVEDMKAYRGVVGKLNWVTQNTRPDLAFEVSEGGQCFQQARGSDMIKLLKVGQKMKNDECELQFRRLKGKLSWEVYSDASYGNVGDGKSQIGYIISLKDECGNRCPIFWKSIRAKRVARSVMDAEALGVNEAAEMAIYLKELLTETIGGNKQDILVKTDNLTLEDGLKSSTGVKSRRLRIDIAAIKEMIARNEIQVEWVENTEQLADVFTKDGKKAKKKAFRKFMYGKE